MQSERSSRFVGSGYFSISCCPLSLSSIVYVLQFLDVNDMSQCFVLHVFEYLVNFIILLFQFISRLCFTSQLYSRNISMLFKFITTTSICFLYLSISTSSSANRITSLFFVLSVLKTLNDLSNSSVLIFSSLTRCLSIYYI